MIYILPLISSGPSTADGVLSGRRSLSGRLLGTLHQSGATERQPFSSPVSSAAHDRGELHLIILVKRYN